MDLQRYYRPGGRRPVGFISQGDAIFIRVSKRVNGFFYLIPAEILLNHRIKRVYTVVRSGKGRLRILRADQEVYADRYYNEFDGGPFNGWVDIRSWKEVTGTEYHDIAKALLGPEAGGG